MSLPAPNLDDRRFQDLVDEAKRLVQRRCPDWTDHNVSDPGVTLIETFAFMMDQLMYRLNRVPELNYIKFLELIGVRLYPATAASTDVTFSLSAPQPEAVRVPTGTEVATAMGSISESMTFNTIEDLDIVPVSLVAIASEPHKEEMRDHTDALNTHVPFFCFGKVPKDGDLMYVGLSDAAPSCAVGLTFDSTIEGVGVDPDDPPLVWEAWDGGAWTEIEVSKDDTGGLNRPGEIVVHLPSSHVVSVLGGQRAGWLRCRVIKAVEGQPAYTSSPKISGLGAATVGGTVTAIQANIVRDEILGTSEGVPGQRFALQNRPVVMDGGVRVLEVTDEDQAQEWSEVSYFNESGPDDPHFLLDAATGELQFGPAVREQDGTLHQYGAVPPKGAILKMRSYATGGGRKGNVARGSLRFLKTTIPYIESARNRHPASGGVDGEDIENAKIRGPLLLRSGNRAVTAEDYEHLAREAAPEMARIHCVEAGNGSDPGAVRVLVVPAATDIDGRLRFEQLVPADQTVETIGHFLDERRMIGARVVVEPPAYMGVTIVASLKTSPKANPERVKQAAVEALYNYFHPIRGGPDGAGWQFGRDVLAGDAYAVLQRVRGVEYVDKLQLFPADPVAGERGKPIERLPLESHALVFSYGHQVRVEESS